MSKNKITVIMVLALLAAFAAAGAAMAMMPVVITDFEDDTKNPVVQKSYTIMAGYWTVKELIYRSSVETDAEAYAALLQQYKKELRDLNEKSYDLIDLISGEISVGKISSLNYFSRLYKYKQQVERYPLNMVAIPIVEKVRQMMLESPDGSALGFRDIEEFKAETFPGYDGQVNPNYYYRKGREISSQILQTYWKEVKRTYQQLEQCSSEVTLDFYNKMENDPNVEILDCSLPYEKLINGVPTQCVKVTFEVTATITLTSKRKYASTKVWFELLVNKTSIMVDKWEVCGKTYEVHEIYAGSEVISTPDGETPADGSDQAPPAQTAEVILK